MKEACRSLKLVRFFVFFSAEFFLLADNCFSSHRFHRFTQIFFIGRFFIGLSSWEIFHRISRMNRKAFLLAGLLTDFRGTLAAGQWLAPYTFPCCFCHADFADDADFSSWEGFVPQISQIYTDFLWNLWRISLSNLRGYLQRPNRSHLRKSVSNRRSKKSPNKFRVIR